MEEEREALDAIFSGEEISFSQKDDCHIVQMAIDNGVYLKLFIRPSYPAVSPGVSVVGQLSIEEATLLEQLGQEIGLSLSERNEVSVFDIYSAVKEQYDIKRQNCEEERHLPDPGVQLISYEDCKVASCTKEGVSLKFLLRFAMEHDVQGFQKWDLSHAAESTGSICFRCVVPQTQKGACDYTSLSPPFVFQGDTGEATCFVSHAWKASFASLVTALFAHQVGHNEMWDIIEAGAVNLHQLSTRVEAHLSQPHTTEHYYWIDIFCKNQHIVQSDTTAKELVNTVSAIANVVLVLEPLHEPIMLTRVWCLFEVSEALAQATQIVGLASLSSMLELNDVILRERSTTASRFHNKGKLPNQEQNNVKKKSNSVKCNKDSDKVVQPPTRFTGNIRRVLDACDATRKEAVSGINIRTAQATVAEDRAVIFNFIEEKIGLDSVNNSARIVAEECIRAWQSSAIDSWAKKRGHRWEAAAASLRGVSK